MDTTYENIIERLSERGRLEWDLAVAHETINVLRRRIEDANNEIMRLSNESNHSDPIPVTPIQI